MIPPVFVLLRFYYLYFLHMINIVSRLFRKKLNYYLNESNCFYVCPRCGELVRIIDELILLAFTYDLTYLYYLDFYYRIHL